MDPEVNEVFEFEGRALKCIEQEGCHGCNFEHALSHHCMNFTCSGCGREDETPVIYIKQPNP